MYVISLKARAMLKADKDKPLKFNHLTLGAHKMTDF